MKELIEPFKKFYHFLLANLIIGAVFSLFTFSRFFESFGTAVIGIIWSTAIFISQWLGHSYIQTQIAKRYGWMEKTVQRLVLTIVSVVVYSVVAFIGIQIIMNLIVFQEIPEYLLNPDYRMLRLPVLISFFVSILAAAYGFFQSWRKAVLDQERLKNEMLSYKYEALRNQINPHFMFNSLNVLSDLVYDDQKAAVKFIHHFSDIYRYVLDSRENELVSLKDEIEFIEKYIFLLNVRFEDKLQVKVELTPEEDDLIVPLSLQLLLENAVKHNEISTAKSLTISITRKDNGIEIKNPLQPKSSGDKSKKIGLKNLEQQFGYFSDKPLIIKPGPTDFSVMVPIIKKEA